MCSLLKLANDVVLLDEAAAGPLHGDYGVRYPVRMKPLDLTNTHTNTPTTTSTQSARVRHVLAPSAFSTLFGTLSNTLFSTLFGVWWSRRDNAAL